MKKGGVKRLLPSDVVAKRLKTFFNLKEITLEQNLNDHYFFVAKTFTNENVLLRRNTDGQVFVKENDAWKQCIGLLIT